MPKFTYEKHQERMRRILTQAEPVERTGVIRSLLDRVRGGGIAQPPEGAIPPLKPPKLPEPRRPRRT